VHNKNENICLGKSKINVKNFMQFGFHFAFMKKLVRFVFVFHLLNMVALQKNMKLSKSSFAF